MQVEDALIYFGCNFHCLIIFTINSIAFNFLLYLLQLVFGNIIYYLCLYYISVQHAQKLSHFLVLTVLLIRVTLSSWCS